MTRPVLLASMLAGALLASPVVAQPFEASSRTLQPIASSDELLMAQAGPRFNDDYDWWDRDWRDRRDRRDDRRYDRRYRDCHRQPDRHAALRSLHRHVGRYCAVQFLRPVRNPRRDQYCVDLGGVRFCAG